MTDEKPSSGIRNGSSIIIDRMRPNDIPTAPGVYIFKNAGNKMLYIGKAADLRARIRQYVTFSDNRASVPFLMNEAVELKFIFTAGENDALLLEDTLIKRHRPKYNIDLKGGRRYPYLAVTEERFPTLIVTRTPRKRYRFIRGPFTSAGLLRKLIAVIRLMHPLRKCRSLRPGPCVNKQMGLCPAPCDGSISRRDYNDRIRHIIRLLRGQDWRSFSRRIEVEIQCAVDKLRFERAAMLRDSLRTLPLLNSQLRTRLSGNTSSDHFLFTFTNGYAFITILSRYDKSIEDIYTFHHPAAAAHRATTAAAAMNSFYETRSVPAAVSVEIDGDDFGDTVIPLLNVTVSRAPANTAVRSLLTVNQQQNMDSAAQTREHINEQLVLLAENFDHPVASIQCVDVSTLYGELTVAGAVWWEHGHFVKRHYRRFRIRGIAAGDDFSSMRQTARRLNEKWQAGDWEQPDLLLIDGGAGQLSAVHDGLSNPREVMCAGIIKDRDRTRGGESLLLPGGEKLFLGNDPSGLLLRQIRDEAHRFCISYNRNLRKEKTRSVLSRIPGVGKKREASLLRHFGTLRAVSHASTAELASVPGVSEQTARIIHNHLQRQ